MSIFEGLSAFAITPCDASGQLLEDALRALLLKLDRSDAQSVGLLGSTGTYAYLTRDTRCRAIRIARETLVHKPLIVGIGALRTDDAILLAEDARSEGADGLLLAAMSYTPLLEDEVFAHFQAVTAAGGLPLCIYNNPGTTHFHFSTPLLQRLADLPDIAAVKMPLPQQMEEIAILRAALPKQFIVGHSGDWGCPDCLLAGGQAWFSVIAGYLPDETAMLARAALAGDDGLTGQINARFQPLWDLFQTWGSLRVIYTAAQIEHDSKAVLPRPLLGIPEDHHRQVIAALASVRSLTDQNVGISGKPLLQA